MGQRSELLPTLFRVDICGSFPFSLSIIGTLTHFFCETPRGSPRIVPLRSPPTSPLENGLREATLLVRPFFLKGSLGSFSPFAFSPEIFRILPSSVFPHFQSVLSMLSVLARRTPWTPQVVQPTRAGPARFFPGAGIASFSSLHYTFSFSFYVRKGNFRGFAD